LLTPSAATSKTKISYATEQSSAIWKNTSAATFTPPPNTPALQYFFTHHRAAVNVDACPVMPLSLPDAIRRGERRHFVGRNQAILRRACGE